MILSSALKKDKYFDHTIGVPGKIESEHIAMQEHKLNEYPSEEFDNVDVTLPPVARNVALGFAQRWTECWKENANGDSKVSTLNYLEQNKGVKTFVKVPISVFPFAPKLNGGYTHKDEVKDFLKQSEIASQCNKERGELKRICWPSLENGQPNKLCSNEQKDKSNADAPTKSVVEILSAFADRTSLPAATYISTADGKLIRSIWCCVVLAMLVGFIVNMYWLVTSFTSYPKFTEISLGFKPLEFPAVTVCNVNPARSSMLEIATEEVQALIKEIEPLVVAKKMLTARQAYDAVGEIISKTGIADTVNGVSSDVNKFLKDVQSALFTESDSSLKGSVNERIGVEEGSPIALINDSMLNGSNYRDLNEGMRSEEELNEEKSKKMRSGELLNEEKSKTTNDSSGFPLETVRDINTSNSTKTKSSNIETKKRDHRQKKSFFDLEKLAKNVLDSLSNSQDDSGTGEKVTEQPNVTMATGVDTSVDLTTQTPGNEETNSDDTSTRNQTNPMEEHIDVVTTNETDTNTTQEDPDVSTDSKGDVEKKKKKKKKGEKEKKRKSFIPFFDDIGVSFSNGKWRTDKDAMGLKLPFQSKSITTAIVDEFQLMFSRQNRSTRIQLGHQIEDMLIDCSFDGFRCYPSNFTLRTSSTFGNCFTLDYPEMISRRSGSSHGLSLILFLEQNLFLAGLTSSTGAQLVLHPKKSVAFPQSEGLAVPAGMEVDIALKLININRLGQPYGDCSDGQKLPDGITYTLHTCQHFCEQKLIGHKCGCHEYEDEESIIADNGLLLCESEEELGCLSDVRAEYLNQELVCDCQNPCSEIVYSKSLSMRQWPTQEYALILTEGVCQRTTEADCMFYQSLPMHDFAISFLKLNIYFEDLNYENVTEKPSYGSTQFVSDIGGTLGLWLGLSMITLVEFIHLAVTLSKLAGASIVRRLHLE